MKPGSFTVICTIVMLWAVPAKAAPALTLEVFLKNRIFSAVISPKGSAESCTLKLYGALARRKLTRKTIRGRLIASVKGHNGKSRFLAESAANLKQFSDQKKTVKIYFIAEADCEADSSKSNAALLRLKRRKRGLRSPQLWLKRLAAQTNPAAQRLTRIFDGLSFNKPVDLQSIGADSYLVEQGGIIHKLTLPNIQSEFLNISDKVVARGEQGLLGLAFHPDFDQNGYFFVNYTAAGSGATVIERYRIDSNDPNRADLSSTQEILRVDQPYANHNAGQLAFGPDGYLYLGLGDGGSGGDPLGHGQNIGTLLGSMLRIDIDNPSSGKNYSIPVDNPYVGQSGARAEIFAYGLRNPWRYSFDSEDGTLWLGDVGQDSFEEINIIVSGGNYGWNTMEGSECFSPAVGCNRSGLILPVYSYPRQDGVAVTGGYVYRGQKMPDLWGAYIFGDYGSGAIWALRIDQSGQAIVEKLLDSGLTISSFGLSPDQELYLLDLAGGTIYLLEAG